jgi:HAD superfamily hydrolase (TIGR01509 family)
MITTFIFDNDGVVTDSERLWDIGIADFLARRGFVYDRDGMKHLTSGGGMQNLMDRFREYYGDFPGTYEELGREMIDIMIVQFEEHIAYLPGFEEFFAKIKHSYKTGIATSSDPELLAISNRKLGLFQLFNHHVYSPHAKGLPSKPAPDIFLHVAKILQNQPNQCVVIEDTPIGLEAARRAGMKSIGLAGTHTADHLTGADIVVGSYQEIDLEELNSL